MRVKMVPGSESIGQPNGISRVIDAYFKYGPKHGIEFVDKNEDIVASHAGMTGPECDVCILHGLYFTGDYQSPQYEYWVNSTISESVRSAKAITVPSYWVSEIIKRDLHVVPFVVPHGIDANLWHNENEPGGYVLYNKNRDGVDVCNSKHIDILAGLNSDIKFISTQSKNTPPNMSMIGVVPFDQMKSIVQKCSIYASLTKETFGIGTLEALASGRPVLGWNHGGNVDLIDHGVTGYLAEPGNYDDLNNGLKYCFDNWRILSANAVLSAQKWKWDNSISSLMEAFSYALEMKSRKPTVSVIIPTYNYAHKIVMAVDSVLSQTEKPSEIIIVNDGSTDNFNEIEQSIKEKDSSIVIINKENGGVATARNAGYKRSTSKYVCFLDADDRIEPEFLKTCVHALENKSSMYIAYTKLKTQNGRISDWPDVFDPDAQVSGKNQVPTCCVMRSEVYGRLGGQRQRFAPLGAGSEDADLWTRATIFGMASELVSQEPLFEYSAGTGLTSRPGYSEVDWTHWQLYKRNGIHPFASLAKPKKRWHDVYQYDEPVVSVIIPVGDYHTDKIIDAIDSVECQTFKKWEIIIVLDTDKKVDLSGFPFVRIYQTVKSGSGPGVARNIGVSVSRGHFVVFLDADDFLDPSFLDVCMKQWNSTEAVIYTDYIGITKIESDDLDKIQSKILSYDSRTKIANTLHLSTPYDCSRAQRQPEEPIYHWCIVTCLIPKTWHDRIGGFDENMDSWEDVDYHWRMAREGYCYFRVPEPLVYYRFGTGQRREHASAISAKETATRLLNYMKSKYKEKKPMPCNGCGDGNQTERTYVGAELSSALQRVQDQQVVQQVPGGADFMSDANFKEVRYMHPNKGDHAVTGQSTGLSYGYRSGGDVFLVHVNDIAVAPHLYIPIGENINVPKKDIKETPVAKPIEESTLVLENASDEVYHDPVPNRVYGLDIETLPGITPSVSSRMKSAGFITYDDVRKASDEALLAIEGIGPARLKAIRNYLESEN
jgi:glycosyltransferase involved in cell wall biosynthesis